MAHKIAILAGAGVLPATLARARPDAWVVMFEGIETVDFGTSKTVPARFEKLGVLFEDLRSLGITQIVFAGAMSRPSLNPAELDPFMASIVPELMRKMQRGDDELLRYVIDLFEQQGFEICSASDIAPSMLAPNDTIFRGPLSHSISDVKKADQILRNMSALDLGQSVVVEEGAVLGLETIQGTDFLLNSVARSPDLLRPHKGKGILVKRPKVGQDLRVDMPAIGPNTVKNAALAGLCAIIVSPNAVLVLEKDETERQARALNVSLIGVEAYP